MVRGVESIYAHPLGYGTLRTPGTIIDMSMQSQSLSHSKKPEWLSFSTVPILRLSPFVISEVEGFRRPVTACLRIRRVLCRSTAWRKCGPGSDEVLRSLRFKSGPNHL
jgi:hypothetical protein